MHVDGRSLQDASQCDKVPKPGLAGPPRLLQEYGRLAGYAAAWLKLRRSAMATLLKSSAAFREKAVECGLLEAQITPCLQERVYPGYPGLCSYYARCHAF